MKKSALIVAGGKGTRMKADIPKQFLLLNGKPILMHTIERFHFSQNEDLDIVVVLPEDQHKLWKDLCEKHHFTIPHKLVSGGSERFYSVKNGLTHIKEESIVAIHDGVRPEVSTDVIRKAYEVAELQGAAVPVLPVTDSLRQNIKGNYLSVNRDFFFLVQTPQVFRAALIRKAYEASFRKEFTDDASVWEHAGRQIHFIEGNKENIKITEPTDLDYMEWVNTKKP